MRGAPDPGFVVTPHPHRRASDGYSPAGDPDGPWRADRSCSSAHRAKSTRNRPWGAKAPVGKRLPSVARTRARPFALRSTRPALDGRSRDLGSRPQHSRWLRQRGSGAAGSGTVRATGMPKPHARPSSRRARRELNRDGAAALELPRTSALTSQCCGPLGAFSGRRAIHDPADLRGPNGWDGSRGRWAAGAM